MLGWPRNEVVHVNDKQLEDQLRKEKFLTLEAKKVGEKEMEREREGGWKECSLADPVIMVYIHVHV